MSANGHRTRPVPRRCDPGGYAGMRNPGGRDITSLHMNRRAMIGSTVAAGALLMSAPVLAQSAALDEARIDAIIAGFMAAFDMPGVAVAIIRPGAPDFAKG